VVYAILFLILRPHPGYYMQCCCEHGNEPSGSIKGGKFLDQLSDC